MELIPFATLTLATGSEGFYMLGATPAGTRIIQEIHSAELVGERITASAIGASSADWLAIDAQGVGLFDIRITMKTDDDAIVYLRYSGRADWSEGLGKGPIFVGRRVRVRRRALLVAQRAAPLRQGRRGRRRRAVRVLPGRLTAPS